MTDTERYPLESDLDMYPIHEDEVMYWFDVLVDNSSINIAIQSGIGLWQVNSILNRKYHKTKDNG